jgi:hypothetical protein
MSRTLIMVGVAGVAFAACIPTEDAVSTSVGSTSASVGIELTCPRHGCDTNAATIGDGILFDELDLSHQPNAGGVRIGWAEKEDPPGLVELAIEGDKLVAFASGTGARYAGTDLIGLRITLFHAKEPGAPEEMFVLRINDVSTQDNSLRFWAGAPDPVESYELMAWRTGHRPPTFEDYHNPPEVKDFDIRVCKGELLETAPSGARVGWLDSRKYHALVYQGDHLDARNRKVTAPSSATLFNLACIGTAMAKLHLLRHTEVNNYVGYPTSFQQRTAMLKMLNADYCGDGQSFTVDGHPLRWQDSTGYMQPPLNLDTTISAPEITSIEAIWGPAGAQCLNVPRYYKRHEIMAHCSLPPCEEGPYWPGLGHVISGNPPPPPSP